MNGSCPKEKYSFYLFHLLCRLLEAFLNEKEQFGTLNVMQLFLIFQYSASNIFQVGKKRK